MNAVFINTLGQAQELELTEGFIGKVVDADSKLIIGWTESATFDSRALASVAENCRKYVFVDETIHSEADFCAHAISIEIAMRALGAGNEYQESYGDYAGLLARMKQTPENVQVYVITQEQLAPEHVTATLERIGKTK